MDVKMLEKFDIRKNKPGFKRPFHIYPNRYYGVDLRNLGKPCLFWNSFRTYEEAEYTVKKNAKRLSLESFYILSGREAIENDLNFNSGSKRPDNKLHCPILLHPKLIMKVWKYPEKLKPHEKRTYRQKIRAILNKQKL